MWGPPHTYHMENPSDILCIKYEQFVLHCVYLVPPVLSHALLLKNVSTKEQFLQGYLHRHQQFTLKTMMQLNVYRCSVTILSH